MPRHTRDAECVSFERAHHLARRHVPHAHHSVFYIGINASIAGGESIGICRVPHHISDVPFILYIIYH